MVSYEGNREAYYAGEKRVMGEELWGGGYSIELIVLFFFFKQKTAYEIGQ